MNDAELRPVVSRVLGRAVADLTGVRRDPLEYDAFLAGRSLMRVRGSASCDGETLEWSIIEKLTDGPATASEYLYDNGLREFRAYESGLLDGLAPKMTAAAVYGLREGADGSLTLWLEDLGPYQEWPPSTYVEAARDLGRLGGRWLGRVPDEPWLFRGWIERHSQPAASPAGLSAVREAAGREEIEERMGRPLDDAVRLIEEQPRFRTTLESLPHTLCHHDAVGANLFSRLRDGVRETVAIDWEMVGPGPVGADLASLLFSSVRRGDLSTAGLLEIRGRAFEEYLGGYADAGASVDEAAVRLGFAAAVALRWALVRDIVVSLVSGNPVRRGSAPHETPEMALDELIGLSRVLLDLAAEARLR